MDAQAPGGLVLGKKRNEDGGFPQDRPDWPLCLSVPIEPKQVRS
jgi:hypothetical protein